eukprot:CAMPEP_0179092160 /NCGR_PEP_ID=MMETSP0796-20121207/42137_1 /TAXON_ID=73915 /ORGANISM="Pyrodinium bahamense, Strain pbaha01" /LENGTH=506 /DNA_ID=CAMNT_0020789763 /DNA_START=64 /DNA_END=1582 /DNA_ORIENTATION=-
MRLPTFALVLALVAFHGVAADQDGLLTLQCRGKAACHKSVGLVREWSFLQTGTRTTVKAPSQQQQVATSSDEALAANAELASIPTHAYVPQRPALTSGPEVSLVKLQRPAQAYAAKHRAPPQLCCMAMTASCLACVEGVSVEEYCADHQHVDVQDCDAPVTPAIGVPASTLVPDETTTLPMSSHAPPEPTSTPVQVPTSSQTPVSTCCMAVTATCLACREGVSVEDYCADQRRSGTPGCEEVPIATDSPSVPANTSALQGCKFQTEPVTPYFWDDRATCMGLDALQMVSMGIAGSVEKGHMPVLNAHRALFKARRLVYIIGTTVAGHTPANLAVGRMDYIRSAADVVMARMRMSLAQHLCLLQTDTAHSRMNRQHLTIGSGLARVVCWVVGLMASMLRADGVARHPMRASRAQQKQKRAIIRHDSSTGCRELLSSASSVCVLITSAMQEPQSGLPGLRKVAVAMLVSKAALSNSLLASCKDCKICQSLSAQGSLQAQCFQGGAAET